MTIPDTFTKPAGSATRTEHPGTTERACAAPSRWSRRDFACLLGGGLALLATGTVTAAPRKRKKDRDKKRRKRNRRRFRTITRTFSYNNPMTIAKVGRAIPYPAMIQVSGFKRSKVLDVNVTLRNLSHAYPGNIDVQLVAPGGRRANIMSDVGSVHAVTNETFILDDQAAYPFPDTGPLSGGRVRPANHNSASVPGDYFPEPGGATDNVRLATFRGINPNGTWRLLIFDDGPQDGGIVAGGWSLRIRARVRV